MKRGWTHSKMFEKGMDGQQECMNDVICRGREKEGYKWYKISNRMVITWFKG